MIYTVTLNPSIDYVMYPETLDRGMTNRSGGEAMFVGGKGINVSIVLHRLAQPTTVLGLIAGFTGDAIADELDRQGIPHRLVRLTHGFSRINVKLKGSQETEINAKGPQVSRGDLDRLIHRLQDVKKGDYVVLSGSAPAGVANSAYAALADAAARAGARVVVDAAGELLRLSLEAKPYLIKPNRQELCELLDVVADPKDHMSIAKLARRLQIEGAANVLITLGQDGALLLDDTGQVHVMSAARGQPVNTVGAGDSMIAGYLTGMLLEKDPAYALRLGTACAGATSFMPGLADGEEIRRVLTTLPAAKSFVL